MARISNNGGNRSVNFSYNPVLGYLIESNDANNAKLADIRKKFADEVWKKGFTGNGGVTAEARKAAREVELKEERLSGEIVAAYYSEGKDESRGLIFPRIRVKIVDGDESYLITFRIDTRQGQMLVRKLINVNPGDFVKLAAFGSIGSNGYADHSISLKNGAGAEIKAPEGLTAEAAAIAQAAVDQLKGTPVGNDKQVVNKARNTVFADFHKKILDEQIAPKFEAFGKTDRAADDKGAPPAGPDADPDSDIPF